MKQGKTTQGRERDSWRLRALLVLMVPWAVGASVAVRSTWPDLHLAGVILLSIASSVAGPFFLLYVLLPGAWTPDRRDESGGPERRSPKRWSDI